MTANLFKLAYALCLSLFLFSCHSVDNIDQPTEVITPTSVTELRATTLPINETLIVTAWGATPADSTLITTVKQVEGKWQLSEPLKSTDKLLVSVVSPSTLKRHKEALLVMERDQTPILYTARDVEGVNNQALDIELKQVQATLSLNFNLSEFCSDDIINEIRVLTLHTYGWIHLNNGKFTTMQVPFEEATIYTYPVNKKVSELTNQSTYKYQYLILPQTNSEVAVWIKINGNDYVAHLKADEYKSNHQYQYDIQLFNRYAINELTTEEKERGNKDQNEVIETPFFTDYEYTQTSEYLQSISNNSGVLFTFWVDSRIDEVQDLEYKLLIRDSNGNIVSRSPVYGGLKVKPYHYEGFAIPIYISVPNEGKYTYQLLLRKKGNTAWYEPDQKSDDSPENKNLTIHSTQPAFVSAFRLDKGGDKNSVAQITARKYDTKYTAQLTISNYSSSPISATIKLYNRRSPRTEHANIQLDVEDSWNDLIGTQKVTLEPLSSNQVFIPYQITHRRPRVKRFAPYICGSITYDYEPNKEYPLLSDGTMLYRLASGSYLPSQIISNSYIINKTYIEVL